MADSESLCGACLHQRQTVHRRSEILDLDPNAAISCSSYPSIFLFIRSMQGPSSRSNAWISKTANNKEIQMQYSDMTMPECGTRLYSMSSKGDLNIIETKF